MRNERSRIAPTRKQNEGTLWERHGTVPSRTPGLTTREVRLALDGDMPVHGVSRATLDALRRISDHLRECFGESK